MEMKTITVNELAALLTDARAPLVIDVRKGSDYAGDPRLLPGAAKRSLEEIETWAKALPKDRPIVVYCAEGKWVGAAAADWLRARGYAARQVEGGFAAWRAAGLPLC
ncbi:MAG: sulfurtransferase [Rhodospirillales bacterium]|jgi:rhodanese-related sulfurtransferase|nr:sulfurtransferase [Rhodospirillales bacterium]